MAGARRVVWGLGACGALLGALVSAASACNSDDSTGVVTGSGDNVVVDNDATTQPGPSTDAGADSPFARVEGSVYGTPDGYAPSNVCKSCACPKTDYCFGGGTGYTSFSGDCKPSTFGIGCQPIPAACGDDASCECLLQATAANFSCVAVCEDNTHTVYCPHP